jgi:AcrR family transcriptional regulator
MEVVAEQAPQRARLLDAMIDVVAEKGYAAATVADAVRAARVSRGTFYALFPSKEACFIEAYRHNVEVLVARIEAATHEEHGDWRARLRAGLQAYLERLAEEPRLARIWLLEMHVAGSVAQAERDATLRHFADRYRRSFEAALAERDDLEMPSDDALFMLAAGVDQLVCARVRADEVETLPTLTDSLLTCAVAQLEGTAPTRRGDI